MTSSINQALNVLVSCRHLPTISIRIFLALLVMMFAGVYGAVYWFLLVVAVGLHLIGGLFFFRTITVLQDKRRWMVLLYLFVPFGNFHCINALRKTISENIDHLEEHQETSFLDAGEIRQKIDSLKKWI
jgi:hypothetical protein